MRLDARERWNLDHAKHFAGCAFHGRGRYEQVECRDLASAREAARKMVRERPTAIYAISGLHPGAPQALVELIEAVRRTC